MLPFPDHPGPGVMASRWPNPPGLLIKVADAVGALLGVADNPDVFHHVVHVHSPVRHLGVDLGGLELPRPLPCWVAGAGRSCGPALPWPAPWPVPAYGPQRRLVQCASPAGCIPCRRWPLPLPPRSSGLAGAGAPGWSCSWESIPFRRRLGMEPEAREVAATPMGGWGCWYGFMCRPRSITGSSSRSVHLEVFSVVGELALGLPDFEDNVQGFGRTFANVNSCVSAHAK